MNRRARRVAGLPPLLKIYRGLTD